MTKHVVIIGGGPAGLTAAYLLAENNIPVTVLEADPVYVGGISRTVSYKGFHFDIGGHRFFSKSQEVEKFWSAILPHDLLERPRSSRIYYRGHFFSYPLRAFEALRKLGLRESFLCLASYAKAQLFPVPDPKNFQDWVTNQFGARLFRIFFKTYTEKVWGMDCREISADWAAQRIKGLSLASAIYHALKPNRPARRNQVIKTLIDSFRYPRQGPGMMWEAVAGKVVEMGGTVTMGHRVTGLEYDKHARTYKVIWQDQKGESGTITATDVISSAPLRELINGLKPEVSQHVLHAANSLTYRDFLTVALILKDRHLFNDNWIYIHDPAVRAGRIQNFKSWSPEMVPDPALCCYGLEYFCFAGDGLWTSSDEALIELARTELAQLGLCASEDVLDGCVVRQPKAYPVYDDNYATHVETIRTELQRHYPSLHLVGRNGMHKYNNQDHAMMTAMLTVRNILAGQQLYDVWQVNQDAEYHETGQAGEAGLRLVPQKLPVAERETDRATRPKSEAGISRQASQRE